MKDVVVLSQREIIKVAKALGKANAAIVEAVSIIGQEEAPKKKPARKTKAKPAKAAAAKAEKAESPVEVKTTTKVAKLPIGRPPKFPVSKKANGGFAPAMPGSA